MKSSQGNSGDLKLKYYIKSSVLSLCLGIVFFAAALSLFAALMSQIDFPAPIVIVLAIVAICAGASAFSYCMCKFIAKKAALIGIVCGLFVYFAVFLIGLFIPSTQMESFNIAKFFAIILSAIIGSVLSVSRKKHK